MKYIVFSHLGTHYNGDDLELAHMYADSVIEVEQCFGYKTWPIYICKLPTKAIREQVCSEDICKFISIVEVVE